MNKVILMGRLTRDPEIRTTGGENAMTVARYSLAVDRRFKRDGEQSADFINCVCFGKTAEFADKYLHKGTKIAVTGRIQTGSYTNQDGQKVYTTDIVVEEHEFCESAAKGNSDTVNTNTSTTHTSTTTAAPQTGSDGFMNIPEDSGEELPFA